MEKAEPGTACVWSRFSDQVTVTVTPSAATVAELIVGAVVSTRKERIALEHELAPQEVSFLACQEEEVPLERMEPAGAVAIQLPLTASVVLVESKVPRDL